jgi:hypothetical protein
VFHYSSEANDYYYVRDEDLDMLLAIKILATAYMNFHDGSVKDVGYSS